MTFHHFINLPTTLLISLISGEYQILVSVTLSSSNSNLLVISMIFPINWPQNFLISPFPWCNLYSVSSTPTPITSSPFYLSRLYCLAHHKVVTFCIYIQLLNISLASLYSHSRRSNLDTSNSHHTLFLLAHNQPWTEKKTKLCHLMAHPHFQLCKSKILNSSLTSLFLSYHKFDYQQILPVKPSKYIWYPIVCHHLISTSVV